MAEIKLKHSIVGRLRVKLLDIKGNPVRAEELERYLSGYSLLSGLEVRHSTGSVIMQYRPETVESQRLLELLYEWRPYNGRYARTGRKEAPACGRGCKECRPGNKVGLFKQVVGLVLLTGYVFYLFLRKVVYKVPVSESPLSLTSVVAGIAAWPLVTHAWNDLTCGKNMSLFPFLAGTFVLAIIVGEAFTALEVIWILRIGMLLEDYVADRSRKAIREIVRLSEKNAYILVDGFEVEVSVDSLKEGDTVVCHTGERIPVDGEIVDGEALIDESPVTGRAMPEDRHSGDRVFAGTIVSQGVIYIKAEQVGDSTYLCRIVHMVESSLENRAPAEKKADMLANRIMKIGAMAIAGTMLVTFDPMRAFTVLLVLACPCATVLAAATAVSAALANAARNHVLIKGGLYLEKTGDAVCFCFDKTGTLTSDVPIIGEIVPRVHTQNTDDILSLAASAEAHNYHPVARAIMMAAEERNLDIESHAVCEFVLGKGVRAEIGGCSVMVGNQKMMTEEGVDTSWFLSRYEKALSCGQSVTYVAKNRKAQAMLVILSPPRAEADEVVKWLQKDGIKEFHIISGDNENSVRKLAEDLGIESYKGDLLPEQKAEYVNRLQAEGKYTVMVGDGINDSLALAGSSIGIAMGAGGAEVAIEAADIALVDSDLKRIVYLRQLSHRTIDVIEQNYMLAMSTNIGGVILGAAGLLSPVMAGALHIVHTLGILVNSGRLTGWQPKGPLNSCKEVESEE